MSELNAMQKKVLAAMPVDAQVRLNHIEIKSLYRKFPAIGTMRALQKRGFVEMVQDSLFADWTVWKKVKEA